MKQEQSGWRQGAPLLLTKPTLGQGLSLQVSKRPSAEPAPATRLPSRAAFQVSPARGQEGHTQAAAPACRCALRPPISTVPPPPGPGARSEQSPPISLQQRPSTLTPLVPCVGGLEALKTGGVSEVTDVMPLCADVAWCVLLRADTLGPAVSLPPPHGKGDTCRPSPHRLTRGLAGGLRTGTAFAEVRHVAGRRRIALLNPVPKRPGLWAG